MSTQTESSAGAQTETPAHAVGFYAGGARMAGLAVAALAICGLAGWYFNITALKSVFPGLVTMKVNTAIGLLLSGPVLALASKNRLSAAARSSISVLSVLLTLLGVLTLCEYLFGWELRIDRLFISDTDAQVGASMAGRMAPTTAFCFVLMGCAGLISSARLPSRLRISILAGLGATLLAGGALALAAHFSAALLHFQLWDYGDMAIHTALGFALLGGGILALAKMDGTLVWSLNRLTTAGFLAGIALLAAAAAISYNFTRQLEESAQWVNRTEEVLREMEKLTAGVSAFGSSQRSFINSGDEHFLVQEKANEDILARDVAQLRRMTADDSLEQKLLSQLESLIAERIAWGEETVVARRSGGLAAAEKIIATGQGVTISGEIRGVIQKMEDGEYSLLEKRQAKAERVSKTTFLLLPLGVFLSVTILSLGLFFLNTGMGERAKAEEKASWLASFPEQNPNPILELDPATGTIHYLNPAITRTFPELASQGARHPWLAKWQETAATLAKDPARIVRREVAVGGSFYLQTICHIPETKRLRVYGSDITERKQIEAAAARLANIVQSSDDAIISKSLDGTIVSWNAGAEKLFGYTAAEAIGKPMLMLFPPERVKEEEEIVASISRGRGIEHFETVRLAKDGRRIDLSVTISPVRNEEGKIIGASKIARDITDRKQAEQRLQEQLGRLNLLHHITRAIGSRQDLASILQVVIHNLENNLAVDFSCVASFDQATRRLKIMKIGSKSSEAAAALGLAEQGEIPVDQNGLSRCLRGELVYEPDTKDIPFPFPQRLARAGFRSLVFAPLIVESSVFGVMIAARRQPGNFVSGECEFLKQLSDHVALASHQSELYDALQKAYDDLRQSQQTLMQQERLRALGQMASGIAHDINNAMSPVSIYSQLLLETEQALSERGRGYLETINRAVDDSIATVTRMGEFYRQREPAVALVPVNINHLLPQVVDLTRARWSDMPLRRGAGITLATDLPAVVPAIMGVESEIREALINLIFNGVDAMPEGGALTLRTKVIDKAASPDSPAGQSVQVEVTDTGIGMDEETRRRCLEPFFTTKGERGTGLGLAMVYGIVKRHNAGIEIESVVGKGTTMRLVFDAAAPGATDETSQPRRPAVPSRLRILAVDDDPLVTKSMRDVLEADGHFVTIANGGQAGIDEFHAALKRNEPYAVVITDLGMPQVDGRKVAAAVKAASPSTPTIMLSGWGQRLVAEDDIPPHVDRVLSKPPKLHELREALAAFASNQG